MNIDKQAQQLSQFYNNLLLQYSDLMSYLIEYNHTLTADKICQLQEMKNQILDFLDYASDQQHKVIYKNYTEHIQNYQQLYDKLYEINTRFEDLQDLNQNQQDIILPNAIPLPDHITYIPSSLEIDWTTIKPGKLIVYQSNNKSSIDFVPAIIKQIYFSNATNEEIFKKLTTTTLLNNENKIVTMSQQCNQNILKQLNLQELKLKEQVNDDKLIFEIIPLIRQEKIDKAIQFISMETKSNRMSPFMQKLGIDKSVFVSTKKLLLPLDIYEDEYVYQFQQKQQCLYFNKQQWKWVQGIIIQQANRQNKFHFTVLDQQTQEKYQLFSKFVVPILKIKQ